MFNADNNRVVRDTGALYPIIQAPMMWIARAQLASAVSAAGALGLLESSSREPGLFQREIAAAKAATARPFGINLAIKFLKGDADIERAVLDQVIASGVKFVTTSAGDPGRYIKTLHEAGITVYHAVPSLEGALKARDAGVDGLIVEGGESAGIRGPEPVHTFVLLQAVREHVDLPIVAAGGIADGRGMAAAFALGAEGVTMGTRFVASRESPVHANYKQAIVDAPTGGTAVLPFPPGASSRVLKTELAKRFLAGEKIEGLSRDMIKDLYQEGRTEIAFGSGGESSALIREVEPVATIVERTIQQFREIIERLSAYK